MDPDPTTTSLGDRNDEIRQLRAENQRLSRALVGAYTEVEVLKADRDRLATVMCVRGYDPWSASGPEPEPSMEPGPWWPGLVARLNVLRRRLDLKPRELRTGYPFCPSGILNAYREGDLSFNEACDILGSVEFSEACATLRRAGTGP